MKPSEKKAKYQYAGLNSGRPVQSPQQRSSPAAAPQSQQQGPPTKKKWKMGNWEENKMNVFVYIIKLEKFFAVTKQKI